MACKWNYFPQLFVSQQFHLLILEITSNELAGVIESSCGMLLGVSGPFVPHAGGLDVSNRTRQKKQYVVAESDDDEYENEETFENKRSKPKRRKVRALTRHVIAQHVTSCSHRI